MPEECHLLRPVLRCFQNKYFKVRLVIRGKYDFAEIRLEHVFWRRENTHWATRTARYSVSRKHALSHTDCSLLGDCFLRKPGRILFYICLPIVLVFVEKTRFRLVFRYPSVCWVTPSFQHPPHTRNKTHFEQFTQTMDSIVFGRETMWNMWRQKECQRLSRWANNRMKITSFYTTCSSLTRS